MQRKNDKIFPAKPLFIPLMGVYYDAFEAGTKTHEYRPAGPRWNAVTCQVGRQVVLCYGYGKRRRMTKRIVSATIIEPTPEFLRIYGPGKQCLAIELA